MRDCWPTIAPFLAYETLLDCVYLTARVAPMRSVSACCGSQGGNCVYDCDQSTGQEKGRALQNEFLHLLEFIYTSGFESARVVKDETWVASEHQFIPNVMVSALVEAKCCQHRSIECLGTYFGGGLYDGGIDLIAIEW